MPRSYVIIGTGVAGLSAAEAIHRHDPHGRLTIIGDELDGYYSRPGIAYYLNRRIPEYQLFPKTAPYLHKLIPNRIHGRVTHLFPGRQEIVLANNRRLRYDRLLLATGSRTRPMYLPGDEAQGIVSLYTLEDVRSILKLAKRCRSAVVIGDSIIGGELAEGLAAHGVQVHMFFLFDRFWPMVLAEPESRLVEQGLEEMGIRIHFQTQVERVLSRKGAVSGALTKAGETISCEMIGVSIGVVSQMELAQEAGLKTERGILVNEYLETSVENVYAAGNVAQVYDPRTEITWLDTIWPVARKQGQIAGVNMAGERMPYVRDVPYNVVKIGGIVIATIGTIDAGKDPSVLTLTASTKHPLIFIPRPWDVLQEHKTNHMRVLVGKRAILGAVVMGDQTLVPHLLRLIRDETDITPIRPDLERQPGRAIELIARYSMDLVAAAQQQG